MQQPTATVNYTAQGLLQTGHSLSIEEVMTALSSPPDGLTLDDVTRRQQLYGYNVLPQKAPPSLVTVFLRQFINPLIYILLIAAVISVLIQELSDAGFIFAVLIINAVIGTIQEYTAQRSASALQQLVTTHVRCIRAGDGYELNATELVPGDIVLLESGLKVPADIRLIESHNLAADESLLTGESTTSTKLAQPLLALKTPLADRTNVVHAGTYISHGRGRGVVMATAEATTLGQLAKAVLGRKKATPPLLVKLHRFVLKIALAVGVATLLLAITAWAQGTPWQEVFLLAVALAVSAIPEGLPIAVTVALAIGMRRMAKRHVIVRNLVAIESLGSCTHIASDKTGTLTLNELTAQLIFLPDNLIAHISGTGMTPQGDITIDQQHPTSAQQLLLSNLCRAGVLCNEAFLGHRNGSWIHHGDPVDVAMLVLAHKIGITRNEALLDRPLLEQIPFESEQKFAATLHQNHGATMAYVKGALESILPMCQQAQTSQGPVTIHPAEIERQMHELAQQGFRVIAVASGGITLKENEVFSAEHLQGLTLLGLVGMIDPLRDDARETIATCHKAGISVSIITGDHPVTALTSARQLGLADELNEVMTGSQISVITKNAQPTDQLNQLIAKRQVFARIEPQQKLLLVNARINAGDVVAVTGDGANDAPALRAAHVGVAMGKSGTDVARENADIIITDDRLSSIVAGIEQGRITYNNIRKVIFLLISTGAAEVFLFLLTLFSGLPLPLLAVQLLWLNLVTNGIQDVALAFDPPQGDEMHQRPRPANERIFNRIMIERVIVAALTIAIVAFITFNTLLSMGYSIEQARNSTLLLMVLFENIHIFNSRSETVSAFRQNPFSNKLLIFGTLAAQLVHIIAMYTPPMQNILQIQPVSMSHWAILLSIALSLLLTMEIHKMYIKQKK